MLNWWIVLIIIILRNFCTLPQVLPTFRKRSIPEQKPHPPTMYTQVCVCLQRTRDELWSPDMKRSINSEKTLSHLPPKNPITFAPIGTQEERNNLQVPGFLSQTHRRTHSYPGCLRILTGGRQPNPQSVFSDKIKGRTRVVSSDARPQFLEATRLRKLLGVVTGTGWPNRTHLSRRWSFHFIFWWPCLGWFGEDMTDQIIVTREEGGVPVKKEETL